MSAVAKLEPVLMPSYLAVFETCTTRPLLIETSGKLSAEVIAKYDASGTIRTFFKD